MKLRASDFRKMQTSVALFVAMIAIAAAGAYFAYASDKNTIRTRVTAQAQRDEAVGKLRRVRSEEAEIKRKSALFQQIQARGIIGEEQRLEWIELLKEIRDKRQLISLRYEIEPQRVLDDSTSTAYRYYASLMKVQIKLLHEEDLTRFLADIRGQAKALIQIRSCSLSRQTPAETTPSSAQPNLSAECRIDWITLREGGK